MTNRVGPDCLAAASLARDADPRHRRRRLHRLALRQAAARGAGDEVVVLDKLTYSGNPANLAGRDVELVEGDICDAGRRGEAGEGCEAVVNFAAETHVDRSILGAAEFIETDVLGTYVLLEWAREHGARLVQVSTDEVYGDVPPGEPRRRTTRSARPARTRRRRPAATSRCSRTSARTASTPRSRAAPNTYGPNQYPEKLIPLFVTNALDGEPLPLYGDGRQRATGCTSTTTARRSSSSSARARPARSTTSAAARSARTCELTHADPRADGRRRADSSATSTTGPATTAATRSTRRSSARSAGSRAHSFDATASPETVAWYRENRAWWEPIKSGEYRAYYEQQYASRLA